MGFNVQFIPKDGGQPINLAVLDNEICAHLGVRPDPHSYYLGWFSYVGFLLGIRKTFDMIREDAKGQEYEEMLPVIDFLEENYVPRMWAD